MACSEIFAPLVTGATVVLAPFDINQDLDTLSQLVIDKKITQLHAPPSLLRLLIEDKKFVSGSQLIRLFSGGEELIADLRDRSMNQLSTLLLNGYGPTETTISVLFHNCKKSIGEPRVPIGRPIANTQIYLLDRNRQLVPPGHTGELYIGGECVGAGYLNHSMLLRHLAQTMPVDQFSHCGSAENL